MSTRQADHLASLLRERGYPHNDLFGGRAIAIEDDRLPRVELAGGLVMTLLSPGRQELRRLQNLWKAEGRRKAGRSAATKAAPIEAEDDEVDAPLQDEPVSSAPAGPQVFLSYSREDETVVSELQARLARDGFQTWRDAQQLTTDDRLPDAVRNAMRDADAIVLCLSTRYPRSPWLVNEMRFALDLASKRPELPVIPLRLEDLELPEELRDRQSVDAFTDHGYDNLVRSLGSVVSTREPAKQAFEPAIEELAGSPFREDSSTANAASIAFLAEYRNRSILVGGDAPAWRLAESIGLLARERGLDRLVVNAFVVPHGGSRHNLSVELLQRILCRRYLFSTDGRRFQHPNRETIARILVHGRPADGRLIELVFNHRSEQTEFWDRDDLKERYGYRIRYPSPDEAGVRVRLRLERS